MFNEVKIHLSNGKIFTINAKNHSSSNFYIQSALLNGKEYSKSYITHEDILKGATPTLNMGASPDKSFAVKDADCPHIEITHDLMTPAPYIMPDIKKQGNTISIKIGDADAEAIIHYTTDGSIPNASSKKYTGLISIDVMVVLKMIAIHSGLISSKVVTINADKL